MASKVKISEMKQISTVVSIMKNYGVFEQMKLVFFPSKDGISQTTI
jgi:hypothetical protein